MEEIHFGKEFRPFEANGITRCILTLLGAGEVEFTADKEEDNFSCWLIKKDLLGQHSMERLDTTPNSHYRIGASVIYPRGDLWPGIVCKIAIGKLHFAAVDMEAIDPTSAGAAVFSDWSPKEYPADFQILCVTARVLPDIVAKLISTEDLIHL